MRTKKITESYYRAYADGLDEEEKLFLAYGKRSMKKIIEKLIKLGGTQKKLRPIPRRKSAV